MVPKRKLDGNMRNYFLFILEKMGLKALLSHNFFINIFYHMLERDLKSTGSISKTSMHSIFNSMAQLLRPISKMHTIVTITKWGK